MNRRFLKVSRVDWSDFHFRCLLGSIQLKPGIDLETRSAIVFNGCVASLTLAFLILISPVQAQEAADAVDPLAEVLAGHSAHGSAFNEGARQAARILGGTGKVDFEVTTHSTEAQKFIDQGVGQLHGFWDLEAERSFRQAAMIDPDCAMAYWGAALATFEKPERAAGFIQEAYDRIENVSEREQLFIKALHRYFRGEEKKDKKSDSKNKTSKSDENQPEKRSDRDNADEDGSDREIDYQAVDESNKKKRAARYLKDLEDIVLKYPDDIEAKALVVHRVWYNARSGWPIGSYVAAEALLKEIFAVNPMHPAHHYRIHVWDRRKPEMALESAGMCGLSAPSIAHMWHMPGHIFSRLHRYDEAVYYQEASARTDHRHMITDHVIPDEIHNYAHNNEWLTRNYVYLGRAKDALQLAINLVDLPRHPKYNATGIDRTGSVIYGQRRLLQVIREFQLKEQLDQVVRRGCFSDLDEDQNIAALRLQGCFVALEGVANEQNYFHSRLKDISKQTQSLKSDEDEQVKQLQEKLDADKEKPDGKDADVEESGDCVPQEEAIDRKEVSKSLKESKKEAEKLKKRLEEIEKANKAIDGYFAVSKDEFLEAAKLLEDAGGEDMSWIAELTWAGDEKEKGLKLLREQVKKRSNQAIPLARLAWVLFEEGEKEEAKKQFEKLRQVAIGADQSVELFARLNGLANSSGFPADWVIEKSQPTSDAHFRPSLDTLGPVHWSPPKAPEWEVIDADNQVVSSESYEGKNYLMVFYLGHGCLHCAEQLQAFGPRVADFKDAGIEMIAVSTDEYSELEKSLANYEGEMPIRLASNSNLDIFKAFRAHDDFEGQPLHGTFLIDAKGKIRWQDISYEPFMDHEFLLKESQRLLKFETAF